MNNKWVLKHIFKEAVSVLGRPLLVYGFPKILSCSLKHLFKGHAGNVSLSNISRNHELDYFCISVLVNYNKCKL